MEVWYRKRSLFVTQRGWLSLIPRCLELLNGALGLALLILTVVIVRDFRKELSGRAVRVQMLLAFFGLSILVFSFKELYKYGPFDTAADPVTVELLETSYLLLTLIAAFLLLGLRKQTDAPRRL